MAGPQAQRPQQGESSASGAPPLPSVSSAPPAPPAPSGPPVSSIPTPPPPPPPSQPPSSQQQQLSRIPGGIPVAATIEQHIEIPGDDEEQPNENQDRDVEQGGKRVRHHRHHRHHQLPLFIRIINYIRNAWTGVKFSSSNDSELEELETTPRYRPDSLSALCRATRFSSNELKRIYRGFKAECPTGVVKEDAFKVIYSQFFPQGANSGLYAHYVFQVLDSDSSGLVNFEEFVQGLSILIRGSVQEKLCWTFSLYDLNRDGFITRDEMTDIVTAVYELMGRPPDAAGPETAKIKAKVEAMFTKMDENKDGLVSKAEFLEFCSTDEVILRSLEAFEVTF